MGDILSYLTVVGFLVAAWAVFRNYSWWQTVTLASGILSLISVVPFVVGQAWSVTAPTLHDTVTC